jgi:hypothetical protein
MRRGSVDCFDETAFKAFTLNEVCVSCAGARHGTLRRGACGRCCLPRPAWIDNRSAWVPRGTRGYSAGALSHTRAAVLAIVHCTPLRQGAFFGHRGLLRNVLRRRYWVRSVEHSELLVLRKARR